MKKNGGETLFPIGPIDPTFPILAYRSFLYRICNGILYIGFVDLQRTILPEIGQLKIPYKKVVHYSFSFFFQVFKI
jgi:hypothetical protein